MGKMTDAKTVQEQYSSSRNLDIRISIHSKYSTNKQGFGNWIFEHYKFFDGCRILELGCGNGQMWKGKISAIGSSSELILSDISDGMLEGVRAEYQDNDKISVQTIDIMDIPFEDETFDFVIANMMLYHVPDLQKGLSEVRRIMKKSGVFYCATFGVNGIQQFLTKMLYGEPAREQTEGFVLQNGSRYLSGYFSEINEFIYEDSLEVTDTCDLVDYFFTTIDFGQKQTLGREEVSLKFESLKSNGIIKVPKDYGMFVCVKN
jgi:ubiquinone/menaquinone biosynthesis C-methylase UbiE